MIDRRGFLIRSAAVAGTLLAVPRSVARAAARAAPGRPRALIQIVLPGGMDALLTTDPKPRSELAPLIDVPYAWEDIALAPSGRPRFGPLMRPILPLASRIAVVNGVVGATVSHTTGEAQLKQLRRTFAPKAPEITQLVGALRGADLPLDAVRYAKGPSAVELPGRSLDGLVTAPAPTDPVETPTLTTLDLVWALKHDPAKFKALCRALEEVQGRASVEDIGPYGALRGLLERFPEEPPPPIPAPMPLELSFRGTLPEMLPGRPAPGRVRWSAILRDTLYILRHRLAGAIMIYDTGNWDSHSFNLPLQTTACEVFWPVFAALVDALERTRTFDGVPLSDEVGILVSSELGRFPIKNAYEGKDHLPEFPALLLGPGIRPGSHGTTTDRMLSEPISMKSGVPSHSAEDTTPTIDDLGATILAWFGADDRLSLGHIGRVMEFLLV
jgi:uncharacterized protein (DUF1501 family)